MTVENISVHVQPYHPARAALTTSTPSQTHPITLRITSKEDFFTPSPRLNVLGLLKSPMVLMMLASGVMMWGLPKMLVRVARSRQRAELSAVRRQHRKIPSSLRRLRRPGSACSRRRD